tara:strand:- start:528 stop:1091 length:564 start_codon:yes stop_codon:yes gene_type:complete
MSKLSNFKASGGSNILEYLEWYADGRTISTKKGDVTVQNVTSYTDATTTYQTFPGSQIEYTPPDGTLFLTYVMEFKHYHVDGNNIGHFYCHVDNSSGTLTQSTRSRVSWYNNTHYDNNKVYKANFKVGGTEDIANGIIGPWTSARTLEWRFREYNSSYEFQVNRLYHIDGTGSYANTAPIMTLIAYK